MSVVLIASVIATVDGPGVKPLLKTEHAGAGHLLTGNDRPLDGCGSAPGRQQGEVEVQPSVLGYIQQIGRHQAPVCDHDSDVGLETAHPVPYLLALLSPERGRSADVQTGLTSHGRHW